MTHWRKRSRTAAGDLGCMVMIFIICAVLALAAGYAYADFGITNLIGFGVKRASAGGASTVVYRAATGYDSTSWGNNGSWDYSINATHTKGATTDFVLIAIGFQANTNWTVWPTAGTGTRVTYCGSTATYVTSSGLQTSATPSSSNDYQLEWWYLRGPSSGACTVTLDIERDIVSGGTGGGISDDPSDGAIYVMEFSGVKSSGTPYEGVTSVTTTGTTISRTFTPTLGDLAVWAAVHDETSVAGTTCFSVDFGSCDAFTRNLLDLHGSVGHYQAAGAKTITLTWSASTIRTAAMTGFHLIGN